MYRTDAGAEGVYIGTVVRTFACTWGRRRGQTQSLLLDDAILVRHRPCSTVLYWSPARRGWRNSLVRGATYEVRW